MQTEAIDVKGDKFDDEDQDTLDELSHTRAPRERNSHGLCWWICCCGKGLIAAQRCISPFSSFSRTIDGSNSERKVSTVTGEPLEIVQQIMRKPNLSNKF